MKILFGCEESQACKLGHEAYSCDLLDCSGGHPDWHFKEDIFKVINSHNFDKIVTFQPCTVNL